MGLILGARGFVSKTLEFCALVAMSRVWSAFPCSALDALYTLGFVGSPFGICDALHGSA